MSARSSSSAAETIARAAKEAFDESQTRLSGPHADEIRNAALESIRKALEEAKEEIRAANEKDMEVARAQVTAGTLSSSLASRLDLFSKPGKWESMLSGVSEVAALPSPLDVCTFARRLATADASENGALDLYRVTCPIGVLLCIFEARPEVIVNIASLAVKSGNAAILKGGKESVHTARVLSRVLSTALAGTQLPPALVQAVENRQEVAALLHQERYIDLVIPRGSNELVRAIQRDARMPVMGHADGLCAAYVHEDAEVGMACGVVVDSKTDYPAACNAVETLLLNRSHLSTSLWPTLASSLLEAGVLLRCDKDSLSALTNAAQPLSPAFLERVQPAVEEDFDTEFLALELAVKVVDNVDEAIKHINTHGSHHTDTIITSTISGASASTTLAPGSASATADYFTRSVSSANVYVNASTRFADGFRYGFGTEVGISTGRTHARGPVGLEGLVIYKYVARGEGSAPHKVADFAPGDAAKQPRKWAHQEIEKTYPTFA